MSDSRAYSAKEERETMTARDFCHWLQGHFELNGISALDAKQTAMIARHLALVFAHEIDPQAGGPAEQAKLDGIHHLTSQPPGDVKYRC